MQKNKYSVPMKQVETVDDVGNGFVIIFLRNNKSNVYLYCNGFFLKEQEEINVHV